MSNIYKVYHNNDNCFSKVYVFAGSLIANQEIGSIIALQKIYDNNPKAAIFNNLFSDDEVERINRCGTKVIFVDQEIHIDDTIETIKKKLMQNISELVFEEIYLYIKKYINLNAVELYNTLTLNNKLDLTQERLIQYISNVGDLAKEIEEKGLLEHKDKYTYNDILRLDLDNKTYITNVSLGQKFVTVESKYIYTINPYDVIIYDEFLEKYADSITSTTNKTILLDYLDIYENTIYLCLAPEVLRNSESKLLSEVSTIKIYFPYLYEDSIKSLQEFYAEKDKYILENKKLIGYYF